MFRTIVYVTNFVSCISDYLHLYFVTCAVLSCLFVALVLCSVCHMTDDCWLSTWSFSTIALCMCYSTTVLFYIIPIWLSHQSQVWTKHHRHCRRHCHCRCRCHCHCHGVNRFLFVLGRHTYITPTSYLELISSFKTLISQKQISIIESKQRYVTGLEKLAFAAASVCCTLFIDCIYVLYSVWWRLLVCLMEWLSSSYTTQHSAVRVLGQTFCRVQKQLWRDSFCDVTDIWRLFH